MCKFQDPSTLLHITTATWYQFFTKMGLILKRVNFGLKHMIWHFSIWKFQYFPHSSAPYGPICMTKVRISIVRIPESQIKGQNVKKYGQRAKRSMGIKQEFRMTVIIMEKQPQIHLKYILLGPLTSREGDTWCNSSNLLISWPKEPRKLG